MTHRTNDLLTVALDGPVAVVTLLYGAGPDGLGRPHAEALVRTFHALNTDPSCRVIVLTGEGDFCPGGDFSGGADGAGDLLALRGRLGTATTLFRDIRRGPQPVIAAVEGKAFGAGLALVAASDFVVAGEGASFRSDALGAGLLPEGGLLWSLPEKIGDAKARELMLLGRIMGADEARRCGLVSEIVPAGGALGAALALARRFESLPFVTVALVKGALFNGAVTMADGERMELDLNPLARQAVDHLEAVAAFLEKRKPSFVGN
ncbi:MAG: enoyl-CoA hydratase/isomerase family protein [Rhodocyclaceae bacterium]|jgi:enoyl-CoA hydratase/carnithine racemase|nr:enoyl-CoA hydratase/isomerase family protein [Rhodocyclaceae bacterium]